MTLGGGIGQAVVGNHAGYHFPANHQIPAPDLGFGAIPDPNAGVDEFGHQVSFLIAPNAQSLPRLGRLSGRPLVDRHRSRLGLGVNRRYPASQPQRHLRFEVLAIDGLIAMDIGQEAAAQPVESAQKGRLLAMPSVHPDITEQMPRPIAGSLPEC